MGKATKLELKILDVKKCKNLSVTTQLFATIRTAAQRNKYTYYR